MAEGTAIADRMAGASTVSDMQGIQSDMTTAMITQATNYSIGMSGIAAEVRGAVCVSTVRARAHTGERDG
jgi:predicted double-glycine peptidase